MTLRELFQSIDTFFTEIYQSIMDSQMFFILILAFLGYFGIIFLIQFFRDIEFKIINGEEK